MDFIQRMIDIREDAEHTQRELGKSIDFNHVQIAKYENRKNVPPIRYLLAFCQYYEISADYLLGLPKGLDWPREH